MKKTLLATATISALAASFSAQAAPFGIYDPRSLAMGGVGVTTATARNASFFNPAALAATKEDEDFAFNLGVAARVSDQDKLIDDIDDLEEKGDKLSDALKTFDATPTQANAGPLGTALNDFNGVLSKVNNKVLDANLFAGSIVAIPSKKFSVGLHVAGRADFGAKLNYQDAALFGTLSNQLTNCGNGDNAECANADATINANETADGELNLQSQLKLRGLTVSEVGLAFARRFNEMGGVDIGLTPKYQKIKTLNSSVNAQSAEIDLDKDIKESSAFNFDVGATKTYGDSWKTGLVIKNVLDKEFDLVNTTEKIKLNRQARLGLSHHTNWTTVGLDVDLTKNKPIAPGFDKETQFVGIGAELDVWLLQLRLGYRHDLAGNYDGMPSVGVGLNLFGLHVDAAVAGNDKEGAASVQIGLNF